MRDVESVKAEAVASKLARAVGARVRPDDSDAPLGSPVGRLVGPAQPLARGGRNIVHAAAAAVAPKDGKRFRAGERVQQFHADSVCAGPETSIWVEGMSGSEDEAEAGQHISVHVRHTRTF